MEWESWAYVSERSWCTYMQSTFATLILNKSSFNVNERKNYGNKVVLVDKVELVTSLIV